VADGTCDYGVEVQRSSAQSQPKRKKLIFGEVQMGKPQKRKELIFEKYRRQNPKKGRS